MKLLPKVFASASLLVGLSFATSPSEVKASDLFFCGSRPNGNPVTMMQTARGVRPLIEYQTDIFGEWTPERRCGEVTRKLNLAVAQGENFLTIGNKNGSNIICSARVTHGECKTQIITVPSGIEPKDYLDKLSDNFYGFANTPLLSRPTIYFELDQDNGQKQPYWNIGEILLQLNY